MKICNKYTYILFAALGAFLLPAEQIQAAGYGYGVVETPYNLTQHHEEWQQFELTAGQARSRIGHTLVNYLLGRTVDQYLELGAEDDNPGRKSSKRFKLRLNHHRALFVYQQNFF